MSPGYRRPGADSENSMDAAREPCDIIGVARCDDRKDRDMDQAQLLSLIGSLYDKLVADVAARVQSQVDLGPVTDAMNEVIDARIQVWVEHNLDDVIEGWVETNLNLDDTIESWVDSNLDLEDAAKEAVSELDMTDIVRDAVQGLTFEVSVS
jgi:hypothetical protein